MVLMSFSDRRHIFKLKEGVKDQTTRFIRKTPVQVGQTLQCYYRSREKKSCHNCINEDCGERDPLGGKLCPEHTNYFGEADVTAVLPIQKALATMGKEEFARKDGFDSWEEADLWFRRHCGAGPNWPTLPYVVIRFDPQWVDHCDLCDDPIPAGQHLCSNCEKIADQVIADREGGNA